jgi:hypothetical protein
MSNNPVTITVDEEQNQNLLDNFTFPEAPSGDQCVVNYDYAGDDDGESAAETTARIRRLARTSEDMFNLVDDEEGEGWRVVYASLSCR